MNQPYIPRRTRSELAAPVGPGGRHDQARRITYSLVAQGLCGGAVFAQVRGMYAPDFSDTEIWNLIRGAERKKPMPLGSVRGRYLNSPSSPCLQPVTTPTAIAAANSLLKGFRCDQADLWHVSPWKPLDDPAYDALPLLAGCFLKDELVNVCTSLNVGITKTRDEWMKHLREHGVPSGRNGCYFRPNPVSGTPTGPNGGWGDGDIVARRFALLESDILPLDLQLAILTRLPLPVVAIIFSGNRSYHALVRADAPDATIYSKDVKHILELLRPFGFDQATSNPSRMSRLPGAMNGEQMQRLVYLNPDAREALPIFGDSK